MACTSFTWPGAIVNFPALSSPCDRMRSLNKAQQSPVKLFHSLSNHDQIQSQSPPILGPNSHRRYEMVLISVLISPESAVRHNRTVAGRSSNLFLNLLLTQQYWYQISYLTTE